MTSQDPTRKDGSAEENAADPNVNPDQALDTGDETGAGSEQKPVDPREAIFKKATEWNRQDREAPEGSVLNGLAPEVPETDDGAAERAPMHGEPAKNAHLPEHLQDDPLADFIVMDGDSPAMRLKVDGREQLIPLDKARVELQKREAADRRLQEAAEWRKENERRAKELDEREARLAEQEAAPRPDDASAEEAKKELARKARELVGSLYTEDEDTAAEKLAALLMAHQGSGSPVPQVDVDAIAKAAAAQAAQRIADEDLRKKQVEAWNTFETEFPEIVADEDMFAVADRISTRIAAEDPNLSPIDVMRAAGRQTLEKFRLSRNEPEPGTPSSMDARRDRKRELQPMPRTTSRPAQMGAVEEDRPSSPSDVIAEMRKARGQPT